MAEIKHRHLSLGWQPGPGLENGPFLSDEATVIASPVVDRNITRPSLLEAVIEGGGDQTGTVTITGTVDGLAGQSEVLTFAGPGTVELRLQTTKRFSAVSAIATTGLVGEAPEATFALRVAPHVDMDYMTESLSGDNKLVDNKDHVAERHADRIAMGLYDFGGDFDVNARPEGGLGEVLQATYGTPTSVAVDGAAVSLTTPISPSRRILGKVTAGTGAGTVTITGLVDGSAAVEVISLDLDALGTPTEWTSDAIFSEVTTIIDAGFTGYAATEHHADAMKHTFTPKDDLDAFFLRKGIDGLTIREAQGLKVEQLELAIKTNSFIVAKISAKGRQDLEAPVEVPAFDPLKPLVFHQTTVERDDVAMDLVMEAVLTEKNTLKARDARDGTRLICDLEVEGGESKLKIKTKFRSLEEYRRFWGSTSARGPASVPTAQKWKFLIASDEEAFAGTPYSLTITAWAAYVNKHSEAVSKRDAIEGDGEFMLIRDPTEAATVTLELVNSVQVY